MDFFAFVTTGFWPAIRLSSPTATSMILPFWTALPRPMLSTIFSRRGTSIELLYENCFTNAGTTVVVYCCFSRGTLSAIAQSLPVSTRTGFITRDSGLVPGLACCCDHGAALDGNAGLLAIRIDVEAHSRGFAGRGVDERDVREVDRAILLDDATLRHTRSGLHVALDAIDAVDDDLTKLRDHLGDGAGRALGGAGDDDDLVALLDLAGHHTTSGASEMIFMNFLLRSSRATGPKMRVPMGSF